MKVNQQPGFVLHCRPYSETSLLVELFTREYGRLTVIAKGARRQKQNMRGVLTAFVPLLVSWSGKGQLPILTGAEQTGLMQNLPHKNLMCGFYMNELLLKFLHRFDAHENLFDEYSNAVSRLIVTENLAANLRVFEKYLLGETGFGLILDHDTETGEEIDVTESYCYEINKGPVKVSPNMPSHGNTFLVNGQSLTDLHRNEFTNDRTLSEARRLTGSAIQQQLQNRSIKSKAILVDINRYISTDLPDTPKEPDSNE